MIKNQVKCNDCGFVYFLEDAQWCIHHLTIGIGTKECPQCHNCICHGESVDQIKDRFESNITKGKFIPSTQDIKTKFGFQYQCKTIKPINV